MRAKAITGSFIQGFVKGFAKGLVVRSSWVRVGWSGLLALATSSSPGTGRPSLPLRDRFAPSMAKGPHGPPVWTHVVPLDGRRHVSVIRARFASTTRGVPTRYRWEARDCSSGTWSSVRDADGDEPDPHGLWVLPRRRTWFVDVTACALRWSVTATNGGAPAVEHVEVVDGARNVLAGAAPAPAFDGSYEHAWSGEPGRGAWTLDVRLPHAERLDRVRLSLGHDAVSVPRHGLGRDYAVARAPLRWRLLGSEDGSTFVTLAESTDARVRRPLVRFSPRPVVALRLSMEGATDATGRPSAHASPMVRDLEAYAADDRAPVLVEPWVLSVNANPVASAHAGPGGEVANDAYFAKFLQKRLASLLPGMARDDRYARRLGGHGELLDVPNGPSDGRALESIEGDDAALDAAFLTASWPPPIVVLSGSNDWDYARRTTASAKGRTRWNPLRSAREGGMGGLASAVKGRVAPFLGFCGGAQILALLEARRDGSGDEIDAVLRRNTGRPIRGFASSASLIRAWPGEGLYAPRVTFDVADPLFTDLAGPTRRTTTRGFPQSHLDLVRPEAFVPDGPLHDFRVVATSLFCSPAVSASLGPIAMAPNPSGVGRCARVTEVFRAGTGRWPLVGAQFHAEQRDFDSAAVGDPPESAADARLFVAAAYEAIVDAYLAAAAAAEDHS
jgi:hypothetical protein